MYTEEERAKFRLRFAAWKDGKKPYDGGRIAEVVITPDLEYNLFLNTLPDNQRLTPEENYTTHRYWELNDKPKNFSLAILKGMYTMEPDGWHANTVSENKKTGEIEFMKPWNHPSIGYEYDWYRSSDPEAVEFRKQYKHVPSAPNAKYVPKYRNGKTPHEEFVEQMGPVLYKELLRTNTPNIDTVYDHMLRLLAYESDYGRSRVARLLHNYGGYGWNGKTYTTFKDDEDFVRHYVLLMNNRYEAAVNADSVQAYGKALKDKGYYEDTLANYTRNLVGMRSLSRSAAAHRLSNPNLYQIKPLALTPAAEQLESAPQFQPVNIVVPEVNTDYSLQNASMQSPAPQSINAWKGKGSPAYGGYSLRMPSIEEYMTTKNIMPRGFKDGKLPKYKIGVVPHNPTNATINQDGTFTDDTTKIFDDFYVTPSGVKTKYGSYTDKNWDRYKQLENYFKYHDQQTGKVKAEPGLEIVSPEYDLISGIRGILQMLPSTTKIKPIEKIDFESIKQAVAKMKADDDAWRAAHPEMEIENVLKRPKLEDLSYIESVPTKYTVHPITQKLVPLEEVDIIEKMLYENKDFHGKQIFNLHNNRAKINGDFVKDVGQIYDIDDPNGYEQAIQWLEENAFGVGNRKGAEQYLSDPITQKNLIGHMYDHGNRPIFISKSKLISRRELQLGRKLSQQEADDLYWKVLSHEKHHAFGKIHNTPEGFDLSKMSPDDYFAKDGFDELAARGTQLKDMFGLVYKPLTGNHLRYALSKYFMDPSNLNNNMLEFFNLITDYEKAAKWLNDNATSILPLTIGVGSTIKLANTQNELRNKIIK